MFAKVHALDFERFENTNLNIAIPKPIRSIIKFFGVAKGACQPFAHVAGITGAA